MAKYALEIVEFKLNDDVTTEAFFAEIEKSNEFVSLLNGFIERQTGKNENGLWIDVIKWQNIPLAKEAAKQFKKAEEVKFFNKMINSKTTKMQHFEIENTM